MLALFSSQNTFFAALLLTLVDPVDSACNNYQGWKGADNGSLWTTLTFDDEPGNLNVQDLRSTP